MDWGVGIGWGGPHPWGGIINGRGWGGGAA